jgi:hypothetical protein
MSTAQADLSVSERKATASYEWCIKKWDKLDPAEIRRAEAIYEEEKVAAGR